MENGRIIHLTGVEDKVLADLARALLEHGNHITCSVSSHEALLSNQKEVKALTIRIGFSESNLPKGLQTLVASQDIRPDNPEVLAAKKLGAEVMGPRQYLRRLTNDTQRIVIAGNKDRQRIINLIVSVLTACKRSFDYAINQPHLGTCIRLTGAPVFIAEGDGGPGQTTDFQTYQHHIVVICGIVGGAPGTSEEEYVRIFDELADATPKAGTIIYNEADSMADVICAKERTDVQTIPYKAHPYAEEQGLLVLTNNGNRYKLKGVIQDDLPALSGAREVLKKIGITPEQFYAALA